MESHGEFGTETSQHQWNPTEKWYGDLSAPVENLVWKPVNTHGVPRRVGESGHSHGVP